MLFAIDQITSWVTVFLGWWIIHQTGGAGFTIPTTLMRLGVAGFTFSLAFVTVMRIGEFPVPWAGPIFKTFIALLFLGIAIFHKRRFGRL